MNRKCIKVKKRIIIRAYALKADQKTAEQHPKSENVFCEIEVFGKEYTDKKEAAKALLKAGMAFTNNNSEQIGAYRGFVRHLVPVPGKKV